MTGQTRLDLLLRDLSPFLHDGRWVYTQVAGPPPPGAEPVVMVREQEGTTLVLRQPEADELSLPYDGVAGWITLRVHSALEAVGLTAAVSRALADAGISANVVAGFSHDHVFVPYDRATEAVQVLDRLASSPGLAP